MNTKLLSLLIALFLYLPLSAQHQKESAPRVDSNGIFLVPDKMPEFPGGMQAMMKYLSTNVKYPADAQKRGVSGRVIVQFVVMEDGTLGQEKVVRGVDPLLDEEALRVVKAMPRWSAGMADGKAVKVRFTIPIMFNLSKGQGNDAARMNIPELTVPVGQEITDRTLEGVWQSCLVQPGANDYKIALLPILKIISADKTFMNIMTRGRDAKSNAIIFSQGEYRLPSDSVYVEILGKSSDSVFIEGTENKISVERLHDNLIKLSFSIPDKERRWVEYWFRIPSPDMKMMAD
ncbi:TonB family protein [Bacteroides congonensis]|uniref:TonB family protein n=1 Tax=Bacteroides congonensis TaxID=1871006 RepID=UPI0009346CF7|nr:TonB family protein [Bacteroides congonensis]